jgi:hypothetical protein
MSGAAAEGSAVISLKRTIISDTDNQASSAVSVFGALAYFDDEAVGGARIAAKHAATNSTPRLFDCS